MARILVVDDDRGITETTKRVLMKSGYEVAVSHEGRHAIEEIKRQKPDLILMDIMMPELNGSEAVKELKKSPELGEIPIIILTALLTSQEYQDMTKVVIDGKIYKSLCKPYATDELLRVVKESLLQENDIKEACNE